jgi:type I restriction enzyme S subunit
MSKTEIPSIRFCGFDDAWEQRQAVDIADYSKGNGYSKGDLTEIGTPIILYGRLYTKYQFAISEVDTFATPKDGSVYSQGNEVIIPASGETAEDIARASAVEKSGVLLGGDLNILRPFNFINPLFLALAISSGEPQKELAKKAQGKSVVHIHNSDIQEVSVSFPTRAEQDRIVAVFRNLDHLITLHQRKFEKLTNVKKSMLEKMFPRNGSCYPEIRFKGFTDPWEQRKLGEVGNARSGVGFPDVEQGGTTGIPFFKVSDMNTDGNENEMTVANNYVTDAQIASRRWFPIEELPAIFFAKVGAAVMLNRKRLCRFPFLLDNNTMAYSLSKESWDADFAKALFETVDLTSLVQVGALPSYNASDVEAMETMLPGLPEQRQIGAYFQQLDNLITLHQRELGKLQSIKKALLEKMFV